MREKGGPQNFKILNRENGRKNQKSLNVTVEKQWEKKLLIYERREKNHKRYWR